MQVEDVVAQLQGELDAGALADRGRLPPERALARRLNISRGTLRKALEALEREGRIWRHVGQGTFAGPRGGGLSDGPGDAISRTNPAEVMEVRLMLEPRIAALAAWRATPAELRDMEAAVARGGAADDTATFERWDGRLHRLIALSARNALLLSLFDTVNAARQSELWGRLKAASLTVERRRAYVRQHGRILSAIRDRATDGAARAMREHLEAVQRHLLR
jgi:DNA-binding FadR family transcriptional regulator